MSDKNTREKLIDSAFEEIHKKGYQGAALADILANAGVHKGSMYHFFANKKEMALASIEEKITTYFEMRYRSISSGEAAYLTRFYETVRDISKRNFNLGCPLANLVQEMSNIDEDFDKKLKEMYANFRGAIKAIFDKAVEAGEMAQCDTARLALFATVVIEGSILSAKASGDVNDYLVPIEELVSYLETFRR
jgi:TetR/AcrR family transcriptional repressor of nem operon